MGIEIRNRIVGSGEESLDQIMFNPRNWRVHPKAQQDALKGVLEEVGWVQQVIVNKRTGNLVDGHLRCQLAMREGAETIPVVYVDLDEAEEELILTTIDPIGAMATADKEKLDELMKGIASDNELVREMLEGLAKREKLIDDDVYTRKITAPTYDPTGRKPELNELYDSGKANKLIAEIEACEFLTDGEREFLTEAAKRHTVFYFDKIADYYAQSGKEVQGLMEASALVIIDFDKAVANGFVDFTKGIADLYDGDYED